MQDGTKPNNEGFAGGGIPWQFCQGIHIWIKWYVGNPIVLVVKLFCTRMSQKVSKSLGSVAYNFNPNLLRLSAQIIITNLGGSTFQNATEFGDQKGPYKFDHADFEVHTPFKGQFRKYLYRL